MASISSRVISFEGFEIDLRRGELRRDGDVVAVEPQVLELLGFLASESGRVITRDELIAEVWGGRIVSDSAIATRINAARQAVGDDGKSQRIIRTVPRRGFMFVPDSRIGEVSAERQRQSGPQTTDVAGGSAKPSIVVLPFENLSGDPDQSFFSDGIADDIITDLSRYDELFVISRQSAFAFHERGESADEFAAELNVAYLLEGSVRRAGGSARVTVQLVEVGTRKTLWAERYSRELEDILKVQEEIATVIVNTLVGQVANRHHKRVEMNGANAIGAYDHALRAQQHIWSFSRESAALARQEAEAAITLDPQLARAHAILGWAFHIEGSNGWSDDERSFDKVVHHAKAAVAADENEPWGHCVLGFILWWRDRDPVRSLEEARLSVRLNPSNAHFRMILGATLAYMGRADEALGEIETAMRFNPLYPGIYLVHRSRALFVAGRYEEALSDSQRAVLAMPSHANALSLLAACYAVLGRAEEARDVVQELKDASPDYGTAFVRKTLPFLNEKDIDLLCDLLIRAGLSE